MMVIEVLAEATRFTAYLTAEARSADSRSGVGLVRHLVGEIPVDHRSVPAQ
jgi:hypothetical protein